jgi:hypothetical protein
MPGTERVRKRSAADGLSECAGLNWLLKDELLQLLQLMWNRLKELGDLLEVLLLDILELLQLLQLLGHRLKQLNELCDWLSELRAVLLPELRAVRIERPRIELPRVRRSESDQASCHF